MSYIHYLEKKNYTYMFKEATETVLNGAAKVAQRINELATKADDPKRHVHTQPHIHAHKINTIQSMFCKILNSLLL